MDTQHNGCGDVENEIALSLHARVLFRELRKGERRLASDLRAFLDEPGSELEATQVDRLRRILADHDDASDAIAAYWDDIGPTVSRARGDETVQEDALGLVKRLRRLKSSEELQLAMLERISSLGTIPLRAEEYLERTMKPRQLDHLEVLDDLLTSVTRYARSRARGAEVAPSEGTARVEADARGGGGRKGRRPDQETRFTARPAGLEGAIPVVRFSREPELAPGPSSHLL